MFLAEREQTALEHTKGQEESLVIGTDLLYDLLEKVNQHKYTIILTHYPFDALKAEEKTQVCRILEQFGVQIWMSGHLHDVLVQQHRKAFYVDLYIMDLQEFLSERCDISECDIVRKQAIFEKIFKPNIR